MSIVFDELVFMALSDFIAIFFTILTMLFQLCEV